MGERDIPAPLRRQVIDLFNPRTENWNEHFRLEGARLVSDTPTGRTTIFLLRLNDPERLDERALVIAASQYP